MTCIVGLVDHGTVYMGCDSAGTNNQGDQMIRTNHKLFRVGAFLMGCSGSPRMSQLVQYRFQPPAPDAGEDVMHYLVCGFIDALRTCLTDGGHAWNNTGHESNDGNLLIGYRGHLYHVQSDYQVGERVNGFDAIGSGMAPALGALFATAGVEPRERIRLALMAAEALNDAVRRPFHIETLPAQDESEEICCCSNSSCA